eukprot:5655073-Pyramimonas_sp.AAC.1
MREEWNSKHDKFSDDWKTAASPKGEIMRHHCGCRKNPKGAMHCKRCGQKLGTRPHQPKVPESSLR